MTEESAQERTEQPTAKRLREAKERGQVPRSRELNTTLIMLSASAFLYIYTPILGEGLLGLMEQGLTPNGAGLADPSAMLDQMGVALWGALNLLLPFFATLVVVAFLAPSLLGGWLLSAKQLRPKWERMNPWKGLKRIFSAQGLIELAKAVAKLLVIGVVGASFLWQNKGEIIGRPEASIAADLVGALELFGSFFAVLAASTILIALVDVPFQMWSHTRQLRMTRQEVKDEMKETEGRPEVKARIRTLQREMAKQRMMEAVPNADVVVTNPTHFAVAIRYEPLLGNAPRLVAKGTELVAQRIRLAAEANDVPVFEAPPLARALYHTTKIGQEIPSSLYLAVAQVLAYVYQLRSVREKGGNEPAPPADLSVPDQLAG